MTSQINPNNIDGSYPVAGVSNNTQGFRDNFTATKDNFQFASDEITALQNTAVLKAALTGQTLDNNLNDNLIYAACMRDWSATNIDVTATSGSITLDYSAGHYQYIATTGSVSLGFANWPVDGTAGWLRLKIFVTNVAHTLTLPSAVSQGLVGIQGISPGTSGVSNTITFAAAGNYWFEFVTTDGGETITVLDLSRPLNVYTNGLTSSGDTTPIGYATGAGGTQTQSTNKSTGVTLNKVCGQITMNNANLASGAEVSFTLTNSVIAATDCVVVNVASGATAGTYTVTVDAVSSGSCRITVGNHSATGQAEAIVLNFVVIKAVSA